MDQLFYDNECISLFEESSTGSSSSSDYTPPHEPQIFGSLNTFSLQTEPNSYTLDIPSLYKMEEKPQVKQTKKKRKTKENVEEDVEKFTKKPEFFNNPEEEKEWKKTKKND